MTELKRIGILSSAKFLTVMMGIVGLILGIIYSVGGAIYDIIVGQVSWGGTGLAFAAIPGMTAMFAVGGLAVGIVAPLAYNLFARWVGGIRINLKLD